MRYSIACIVASTLACLLMILSARGEVVPPYYAVKEAVFPFIKFPGVDTILGPEMKSTGEVMGVADTFAEAFVKSQLAAGVRLTRHRAEGLANASDAVVVDLHGVPDAPPNVILPEPGRMDHRFREIFGRVLVDGRG